MTRGSGAWPLSWPPLRRGSSRWRFGAGTAAAARGTGVTRDEKERPRRPHPCASGRRIALGRRGDRPPRWRRRKNTKRIFVFQCRRVFPCKRRRWQETLRRERGRRHCRRTRRFRLWERKWTRLPSSPSWRVCGVATRRRARHPVGASPWRESRHTGWKASSRRGGGGAHREPEAPQGHAKHRRRGKARGRAVDEGLQRRDSARPPLWRAVVLPPHPCCPTPFFPPPPPPDTTPRHPVDTRRRTIQQLPSSLLPLRCLCCVGTSSPLPLPSP